MDTVPALQEKPYVKTKGFLIFVIFKCTFFYVVLLHGGIKVAREYGLNNRVFFLHFLYLIVNTSMLLFEVSEFVQENIMLLFFARVVSFLGQIMMFDMMMEPVSKYVSNLSRRLT